MSITTNDLDKLKKDNEGIISEEKSTNQFLQKDSGTDLEAVEETLENNFDDFEDDDDEDDFDDEEEQSYYGQFSKSWDELTFSDNFLFCKIMEDEEICRQLLEILLPIKIEKIRYLSQEKEFKPSYRGRSIRMDVFLKDSNRMFDIEIQTSDFKKLALRARFYQGALDVSTTKKRAKFSKMKESYILFLCKGDPFDSGIPVYTVKQTFFEQPDKPYDDRTHKVFYNCKAYEVADDEDLKGLLEFIQTNRASTAFSHKLEENVRIAKKNSHWEEEYMYFSDVLEEEKDKVRRIARKQGRQEGLALGKQEGLALGKQEGLALGKQEGLALGKQEGIELGKQEGARENAIENARNFLKMEIATFEQIAQGTGLSVEEVQKLAEEIEKEKK